MWCVVNVQQEVGRQHGTRHALPLRQSQRPGETLTDDVSSPLAIPLENKPCMEIDEWKTQSGFDFLVGHGIVLRDIFSHMEMQCPSGQKSRLAFVSSRF